MRKARKVPFTYYLFVLQLGCGIALILIGDDADVRIGGAIFVLLAIVTLLRDLRSLRLRLAGYLAVLGSGVALSIISDDTFLTVLCACVALMPILALVSEYRWWKEHRPKADEPQATDS